MDKKIWFRWIFAVAFIAVASGSSYLCAIDGWYYLPFINTDYGKVYNTTRIRLGRPIIEEEFEPRIVDRFGKRQVWALPDSLWRKRLHKAKRYETNKGKITFERDTYSCYIDSVEVHDLVVEYEYTSGRESFELNRQVQDEVIRKRIDKRTADSLLAAWKRMIH